MTAPNSAPGVGEAELRSAWDTLYKELPDRIHDGYEAHIDRMGRAVSALPRPQPDPRLVEWGYSSTDEALTHLGKLLDDQAAFDGLARPQPVRPPKEAIVEVLHPGGRDWSWTRRKAEDQAQRILALFDAPPADQPAEREDGPGVILRRLVDEVESFKRAPDNARIWLGGWSTYSGNRDPSLVHVGEVRAALSAAPSPEQGKG